MVINEEGKRLGVMEINNALELAREKDLDLVEVSPNLNPPVCKIMDYGKYLYKIAKQKRQHSLKQKRIETKALRLTVRTEEHDLKFKAKNAVKFMEKGNRVKIDMILKGREKAHWDFARQKLENFLQIISDTLKENSEIKEREITKEQDIKKTPQGFSVVINCKDHKKN
jgi:translation initiation factor IF-3